MDSIIVDWNKGEDSFLDMFLMSQSSNLIVANSTFSYWAARLNQDNILTIYPKKWYNSKYAVPDIFPSEWVGV